MYRIASNNMHAYMYDQLITTEDLWWKSGGERDFHITVKTGNDREHILYLNVDVTPTYVFMYSIFIYSICIIYLAIIPYEQYNDGIQYFQVLISINDTHCTKTLLWIARYSIWASYKGNMRWINLSNLWWAALVNCSVWSMKTNTCIFSFAVCGVKAWRPRG